MSVLTIYPYLLRGTWVFDDERTHLKEEAFVLGMTEMITRITTHKDIQRAAKGFALSFSNEPFDGHDVELEWVEEDASGVGNWYRGTVAGSEMTGWLCPALQLYFEGAPPRIFVKAERLPPGVTPIWNPSGDVEPRRFVEAPPATPPENSRRAPRHRGIRGAIEQLQADPPPKPED